MLEDEKRDIHARNEVAIVVWVENGARAEDAALEEALVEDGVPVKNAALACAVVCTKISGHGCGYRSLILSFWPSALKWGGR